MLFTSFEFLIFFCVFFLIYWFLSFRKAQLQNYIILIAGYVFYAWWDWRFLFLITFSAMLDYVIGIQIEKQKTRLHKKWLMLSSIIVNIGILVCFKYFNFFADSFISAFLSVGIHINPITLKLILPIGISFYTFKTVSYIIDVYRGHIQSEKNPAVYLAYVSFFPQLAAGPIERAGNLLPQFHKLRKFNYTLAADGAKQVLWGLFKKVVIADTLALFADPVFNQHSEFGNITLLLALFYFAFQVYCDFSGYSDIAIGLSKMMGFNVLPNFAYPYFSRNVSEFWRRWHISLSSWLRDYIFTPLVVVLRSIGKAGTAIAVIVTFVICGLWHGASWPFVFWGLLNGLFILPVVLFNLTDKKKIVAFNSAFPSLKEIFQIMLTFGLIMFSWVFFRQQTMSEGFLFLKHMLSCPFQWAPQISLRGVYFIVLLIIAEWLQRRNEYPLYALKFPVFIRWFVYVFLALLVLAFYSDGKSFIYFQF